MKSFNIFLLLNIVALIIVGVYRIENAAERNTNRTIDTIKEYHQKRLTLDSLYAEHLKECSFVSNKDVFVDKWGHVRVKVKE